MATRQRTKRATTKRGSVTTTRSYKHKDGTEDHVPSMSKEFDVDLEDLRYAGHVSVSGALTRNMGDYNNVKVGIMVTLPADYRTDEGMDAAKERAARLLDKYLDEEYKVAVEEAPFGDED